MADRHPRVVYADAVTTKNTITRCYPSEVQAFDDMATFWPYNNTRPTPQWCVLTHCPRGCRTGGAHDKPVLQDERPDGRYRCPKCHVEYTPGEPVTRTADEIAQALSDVGLILVNVRRYGDWPVCITGVFPVGGDAGLHVVRVAESVNPSASTPSRLAEPLWMGLYKPDALGWVTGPIEQWERSTLREIRDRIIEYL